MNWSQLISGIQKRDLSQKDIAAICDCGQTTISDLLNGATAEPKHALGEQLILLSKASDRELKRLRSKQKQEA